ncbi:MAG: hypothetical protein GY791_14555 [Alphaproteobacteria bacterium]|nr:hypothetical protein [Alphaproteobacteria bacterium]
MEFLFFIVVAIGLYFLSDWVLRRIETYIGRQFEYRTIYFFVILFVSALIAFDVISRLLAD